MDPYPFRGPIRGLLLPLGLATAGALASGILEIFRPGRSNSSILTAVLIFASRGFAVGAALALSRRPIVSVIAGFGFGLMDVELGMRLSDLLNSGRYLFVSLPVPVGTYIRLALGTAILVLGSHAALRVRRLPSVGRRAALGVQLCAAFVELWSAGGMNSPRDVLVRGACFGVVNWGALAGLVWLAERGGAAGTAASDSVRT
jgi:hypothetical protein